jgi:uncharacterized SAM-binding protein YcdF (DUF218 family)
MLFFMKKLVAPFLLPPGIFVLLLLVVGLAGMARRHWRMGVLNLFLGLGLYALSISPVSSGLLKGLEADFSFPTHPNGDVIVLLGGGSIQGVPDLTGTGVPNLSMMGRIVTATRLYRQVQLPIIVTGGRWFDEDVSEAQIAKRFLMDLGVPKDAIIKEEMARDTAENARFTAAICRHRGFSRPIVLTSAFHLKRALITFDRQNLSATPFPAYFLGTDTPPTRWTALLPQASSFYLSAIALHEYLGIWYYRIVG